MKRFVSVAVVCLVAVLGIGASAAQAQAAATPEPKMYGELNFGPTLGHKSDKFFGGEFGFRLTRDLDVIVEAAHMGNVGTSELDTHATNIANTFGATASTAYVTNHGAVGVRYTFKATPMVHPYAMGAVGIAQVSTQVEFAVNGTVVPPPPTVQLGGDLSGTHNKTIIVFGFGVNVPFKTRFFADLGYRYGQILADTEGVAETDTNIPTQRIVLGVGIRF